MAATIKDFEAGKSAFLLRQNGYEKYDDTPLAVTVTKVGRKLVTVKVGAWERRFEKPEYDSNSEHFNEKVNCGYGDVLFPSMKAYERWKERRELLEWFRTEKERFGRHTTDQLRAAKKALCSETNFVEPVKSTIRKVLCYKGTRDMWSFFVKGERNPCGCGSNCYHYEYDGAKVIGVCNACHRDIYEVLPNFVEDHLNMGTWINDE